MRPFWDEKLSILASDAPNNERAASVDEARERAKDEPREPEPQGDDE